MDAGPGPPTSATTVARTSFETLRAQHRYSISGLRGHYQAADHSSNIYSNIYYHYINHYVYQCFCHAPLTLSAVMRWA